MHIGGRGMRGWGVGGGAGIFSKTMAQFTASNLFKREREQNFQSFVCVLNINYVSLNFVFY